MFRFNKAKDELYRTLSEEIVALRDRITQLEEANARPTESDEERITMNQLVDEWMNGKDDGDA